jgi:hypothetical protein
MKKALLLFAALFLVVVASQSSMALVTYSGSLSTPSGIYATGPWMTDGMIINWEVSQNVDMSWHYRYSFRNYAGGVPTKGISHMIVAISPNATLENFWGANGAMAINTYSSANPSNPGMPSPLYALKLDFGDDEYYFNSSRAPVWGDFYIKDGNYKDENNNQHPVYAYNSTFGSTDPTDGPSNGSVNYKILRPDSFDTQIPEPSTLLLFGTALAAAGGVTRLRRK